MKKPSFSGIAALNRRPMMAATIEPDVIPSEKGPVGETIKETRRASASTKSKAETTTRAGVRGDQEDRRPVRRGKRAVTFWVNPEPHKQFKMLSVREERPGQDLMEEALNDLFAKYGMHRIASQK
jgi:hypothetical protein